MMDSNAITVKLNEFQSTPEELELFSYPTEVQEQFYEFVNTVPFIKYIIGDRPRAKDLERDEKGRIKVDITRPHILEDMDYFRQAAIFYQKNGCYTFLRPNPNPNSEYGKWCYEEIRRCREGYVRESDGEWIPGSLYFFLNYCPIPQTKTVKGSKRGARVIDFPEFWEGIYWRMHYIEQAREQGKHGCEISSRGKAHPYSQIVYTPSGCKSWGEVQIGDTLFGDDGESTTVIDIPYDGFLDIYKITLKDGRTVESSGNHLWRVWRQSSHCFKTLTTEEMMADFARKRSKSERNPKGVEYNYKIPNHKGVDFNEQEVPVDPYTMGLLLGDGSFRTYELRNSFYYTSSEEDMETYKGLIPYPIRRMKNYLQYYIDFPDARGVLEKLGLYMKKSEGKFIPDCYIFNSRKVRLNLLKGIMDADGFVDSNGIPIIGVSSKRLADNIAFLARSLGYNCLQSVKPSGYKDKNGDFKQCLDSHVVRIFTNDKIFNLKRKYELLTKFESAYSRSNRDWSTIVDIEWSHKERCKCVTVDNESSCYLIGDFITTHNSKSLSMSAIMAKLFVLGESEEICERVKCMATAYQKQYLTSDGILNKFEAYIDFLAQNTQWPSKRLKSSMADMTWTMGYRDLDTGTAKGTLNEVYGVSAKDDPSKVRGKRLHFIVIEEFGSFKNVLELYNIMIPSVQEGEYSFGQMYLIGTAGDDESDFSGAAEIVYNPNGYRMLALNNVFDIEGRGRPTITFFFPGYINRKGCYDKNGNSDVTKAILEILADRFRIKYNSSDINSITKAIAEIPITPQEAILRTQGNIFPVAPLTERLNQLDANPSEYNDVLTGTVIIEKNGEAKFIPTSETPIREFPVKKDNSIKGAVEIFQMPEKNPQGQPYADRYIIGHDPVDHDVADSVSLTSTIVLDLFTDRIVAEYTGRQDYADENFEIVRALCLLYNAKCLYEQNKKGIFAYFSAHNCTHLLADTPEYLRDKQLIKFTGYGNTAKGVNATLPINKYADDLIRNWLLKPITTTVKDGDEEKEVTVSNLFFIRNRALLKELILCNPDINVDRVRALGMAMLYREEKMILYQGNVASRDSRPMGSGLAHDPFFESNYDGQ
jgi:hypothetical protein